MRLDHLLSKGKSKELNVFYCLAIELKISGGDAVRRSESRKAGLSSDRGLQLGPVKSESLVIADQQRCGEYVLGPCTHRPSRHESW